MDPDLIAAALLAATAAGIAARILIPDYLARRRERRRIRDLIRNGVAPIACGECNRAQALRWDPATGEVHDARRN